MKQRISKPLKRVFWGLSIYIIGKVINSIWTESSFPKTIIVLVICLVVVIYFGYPLYQSIRPDLAMLKELKENKSYVETEIELWDILSKNSKDAVREGVAGTLKDFIPENPEDAAALEKVFVRLLNDGKEKVRAAACDSLGSGNSPGAIALLQRKMTTDPSKRVRRCAAAALANIAYNITYDHKLRIFFQKALINEEDWSVKRAISKALKRLSSWEG